MCLRNEWDEAGGDMAPETFRELVDQFAALGSAKSIQFGGFGEPLCHPSVVDFVRAATDAGLAAELVTNGLLLSREALAALMKHPFPGNVRELENIIQAAVALAPGETITAQDLRLEAVTGDEPGSETLLPLRELELRHIERVLREVGGNRQEAARILGIDRSTLYRKMQRFATDDAERTN